MEDTIIASNAGVKESSHQSVLCATAKHPAAPPSAGSEMNISSDGSRIARQSDPAGAPVTETNPRGHPHFREASFVTLLLAVAVITFLVRERERKPVPHISFGERLSALPPNYRRFLVAVGLFGAGDFAHDAHPASRSRPHLARRLRLALRWDSTWRTTCATPGFSLTAGLAGGPSAQTARAGRRLQPRGADGGAHYRVAIQPVDARHRVRAGRHLCSDRGNAGGFALRWNS